MADRDEMSAAPEPSDKTDESSEKESEEWKPEQSKRLQPGEKAPAETLKAVSHGKPSEEPDVWLDVPELKLDELSLEVDQLDARVALHAALARLVELDVGADVTISRVALSLKGVSARATLKVRLEHVYAILDRALTTLEARPEILRELAGVATSALGPGGVLQEATKQVGQAATAAVGPGGAVPQLTEGVGRAAESIGSAVPDLASAATRAVDPIAGSVGQVTQGAERSTENLGAAAANLTERGVVPPSAASVGVPGAALPQPAMAPVGVPGTPLAQASAPDPAGGPQKPATGVRLPRPPRPLGAARPPLPAQIPLFAGSARSAEGWRLLGEGHLAYEHGAMQLQAGPDLGLAYYCLRRFGDFRMRVGFRPDSPDTVIGAAVRFLNPLKPVTDRQDASRRYEYANPAQVATDTGFEVQLGAQRPAIEPGTVRGVLVGKVMGAQQHAERAELKTGDWNRLEIDVRGDDYIVRLNGKETSRFHNVDPFRGRPATAEAADGGFVGFVVRQGRVSLRDIMIEVPAMGEHAPTTVAASQLERSEGEMLEA